MGGHEQTRVIVRQFETACQPHSDRVTGAKCRDFCRHCGREQVRRDPYENAVQYRAFGIFDLIVSPGQRLKQAQVVSTDGAVVGKPYQEGIADAVVGAGCDWQAPR